MKQKSVTRNTHLMARTVLLIVLACCMASGVRAQGSEPDVRKIVALIESGQGDQVRSDLPSLLSRYPNNPGILYIQGLLTEDGTEAVRIYQSIVDNFPRSEWADAALYKAYQFYYSLGLYRTAELKLNQLKADYPGSKYLAQVAGVRTQNLPEERVPPQQQVQQRPDSVLPPTGPGSVPGRGQERFMLQVGAYTTMANAERQKRYFQELGYPVEILSKVKDSRSLFTVLVGNYRTYDEAKAKGGEIRQKYNVNSFVISR